MGEVIREHEVVVELACDRKGCPEQLSVIAPSVHEAHEVADKDGWVRTGKLVFCSELCNGLDVELKKRKKR